MPRRNWIEEADMSQVMKEYKQFQPVSQGLSKRQINSRRMLNKLLAQKKEKLIGNHGHKKSAHISNEASGTANQNDEHQSQQQQILQSEPVVGTERDANLENDHNGSECDNVPSSSREPCIVKYDNNAGSGKTGQRRKLVVEINI